MVASNAREALKEENQLLDKLVQAASTSGSIGEGWVAYFSGWRDNNEKLIGMADLAFAQALNEEIKRLESMRSSIAGDSSPGAKYWKDALGVDIESAKELL